MSLMTVIANNKIQLVSSDCVDLIIITLYRSSSEILAPCFKSSVTTDN